MSVLRSLAVVLGLALSASALAGASVSLASDGEPAKIGSEQQIDPCQGASRVKLRVAAEPDARLEVVGVVFGEGEDLWSWKFQHDGDFSARGRVRAKERENGRSFRIVRSMVNFAGPDVVTFRARNDTTGERCRSELAYSEDSGRPRS